MAKHLFSQADLDKLEATVKQAEAPTGGEIVPIFANQSSNYEFTYWRAGAAGFAGMALLLILVDQLSDILMFYSATLWLLLCLTAGLLCVLAVEFIPSLKRSIAGKKRMQQAALLRAQALFLTHGVTATEQRTGILLYISFFEHQAVILGDYGIQELVPPEKWNNLIAALTKGLKARKRMEAITQAILDCGKVLEDSGVQSSEGLSENDDDNYNELSDEVRFVD